MAVTEHEFKVPLDHDDPNAGAITVFAREVVAAEKLNDHRPWLVFLQGGPVAKLVGRRTDEKLLQADPSHNAWSGPLAVLVTNGTAGPGEIVAAALVDAGRAKLVGEHTFGRAAVSKTITLPEGALVVTVAKYMSPKGTSIHGQGLAPTVPVAQEDEDADTPEGAAKPDRILEKGLEVLKAEAPAAKAAA